VVRNEPVGRRVRGSACTWFRCRTGTGGCAEPGGRPAGCHCSRRRLTAAPSSWEAGCLSAPVEPYTCRPCATRSATTRCHRSSVAGCTNRPCQTGRGSSRARPASTARSARPSGVGPLGGGAPRPRAATPAAPRSWSPSAAPAAPAIPAAGRGSDSAVVTPSTDHLRQRLPRRSRRSEPTAGLSGTHRVRR
jgi:hypothetical protein